MVLMEGIGVDMADIGADLNLIISDQALIGEDMGLIGEAMAITIPTGTIVIIGTTLILVFITIMDRQDKMPFLLSCFKPLMRSAAINACSGLERVKYSGEILVLARSGFHPASSVFDPDKEEKVSLRDNPP
jgi:hypothetical protein